MTFHFHPEAESELQETVDYYEACISGLGKDFSQEAHSGIERILAFPHAWPIIDGEIRRCMIHRFPYGLLYAVDKKNVLILAVMHLHRTPGYWKARNL